MIINEILIIIVLLAINAFFALSEMAIVSVKKPLLKQFVQKGNRKAKQALDLSENPAQFLSTVQVGITLVGTLAGAYGGATIAEKLSDTLNQFGFINPHGELIGVIIVVSIITYLSVIFGELIPKQVALGYAEKVAMLVAAPINVVLKISYPIVWIFENSANILIKVLGLRQSDEVTVTETEIHALLQEGFQSGIIEQGEHEMLRRIIKLGDRDIKSIMTHRREMVCIDVEDSISEIREKIKTAKHSRYPLIEGDSTHVIGFIDSKEFLEAILNNPNEVDLYALRKEIIILPENTNCLAALEKLKSKKSQVAFVVDEYGGIEGIITFLDILEAITGVLPSNYDHSDFVNIIQRNESSWLVSGKTPVEEIQIQFGLEDEDLIDSGLYDTISGLLVSKCNFNPKEGMVINIQNYTFEIVDMDSSRIDKILVTRMPFLGLE